MNKPRRATVAEVRPTTRADGDFFQGFAWIAVDTAGRMFGAATAAEARRMAEQYNR